MKTFATVAILLWLLVMRSAAQASAAAPNVPPKGLKPPPFDEMLDLSRPSGMHRVLAALVGTWKFTGRQLPPKGVPNAKGIDIGGTVIRKSLYQGRFFLVETTSDKTLQIPVPGGFKDERYHGMDIEGYDNVKQKFVTATIGNHIGSDIVFFQGNYDPSTMTITYDSEQEMLPGVKVAVRRRMKIMNSDHYTVDFYDVRDGVEEKTTEIHFDRQQP